MRTEFGENRYFRIVLVGGAALLAIWTSGCARAVIGSDIKPDGSWTRTIEYHVPAGSADAAKQGASLMPMPKLEDVFVVPKAGYTISKTKDGDEAIVKATRNVALNEVVTHDITILSDANKENKSPSPVLVNETSVKETSPGVYTYSERLHWVGPIPKKLLDVDTYDVLKKQLPPELAKDAAAEKCAKALSKELIALFFGPPSPLFGEMMTMLTNPDLAKLKLAARMRGPVEKVLKEQFGDKLSPDMRITISNRITNEAFDSSKSKYGINGDPTAKLLAQGQDSSPVSGAVLTFAIKYPGTLVSSNGETDSSAHKVFWGMYPEAAVLGDITLTAVVNSRDKN